MRRKNSAATGSSVSRRDTKLAFVTVLIAFAAVTSALVVSWRSGHLTGRSLANERVTYPVGQVDHSEPSGLAPPGANSFPGFKEVYVNDFSGRSIPKGWNAFSGKPGGSPGGQFAVSHLKVVGGELTLNTWRDPAYGGKWVTAGLCQCGMTRIYGAYFVRSRITGGGANEVQLLWPATNAWPPEVDFNESGGDIRRTTATLHYGGANLITQNTVYIDMLKWHTWGVVWTSQGVTYVVDGKVWGSVKEPQAVPSVKMRLDLEQRTQCLLHAQCPKAPVSMLVDWVAEFVPVSSTTPATA